MGDRTISEDQKLAFIIRHAAIGVMEIKEDGEIVSLNIVAEDLTKLITGGPVKAGANGFDLLSLIDPAIAAQIKNFKEPGGPIIDSQLYSAVVGGDEKHFLITTSKMFADCIIVGIDDITVRYSEEKALQLAEQEKAVALGKYEIASEVLHDIGNALVGFGSHLTKINRVLEDSGVENLEKLYVFIQQNQQALSIALGDQKTSALITMTGALNTSIKKGAELVKGSVTEQLRVVAHIQDILNIQRQYVLGNHSQERKPVNLKEIIGDCRSMIDASLEKRKIRFFSSLPAVPVHINGDRTKLMQVILNLLKNSIEAIDPDGNRKEIHLSLSLTNHKIILVIFDSGKGFDSAARAQMFTRGYTSKSQGTGIGLYTSKSIIESHGGSIAMESQGPGKGSTTTIEFNCQN